MSINSKKVLAELEAFAVVVVFTSFKAVLSKFIYFLHVLGSLQSYVVTEKSLCKRWA